MVLAKLAAGAGDVEVPEADRPDPVRRGEVADHPVHGQLRGPVGVHRLRPRRLCDRDLIGLPVDGARRRENESRNARRRHRLEQVQSSADVRSVVALRMADGFAHQRQGGEVQHGVEALVERQQHPSRSSRSASTRRAGSGTASRCPCCRLSNTTTSCSSPSEPGRHDRADVTRAAGDEKLHVARYKQTYTRWRCPGDRSGAARQRPRRVAATRPARASG